MHKLQYYRTELGEKLRPEKLGKKADLSGRCFFFELTVQPYSCRRSTSSAWRNFLRGTLDVPRWQEGVEAEYCICKSARLAPLHQDGPHQLRFVG
jgi:hypothetical protein